jgi:hypothetical protein
VVLISLRGLVDPRVIVRLEGLGKLKKSNDLIGIRTRDLPACNIVLEATALPLALEKVEKENPNKRNEGKNGS